MVVGREGQQLGNYKLIHLLGTGGFADVYLGEHLYLGSQAAIKVLHTALADEDIADFLTEARRLVSLRHPHIVRVLDFAVEKNIPFLVMEYVPNGSLRTRYPKGSRLPLEMIVSYVQQVADALQYIHDKKLIHRDVKPENILLRTNNEVVLSDFGIAAVSHTTGSLILQGQAGTPAYMAPEQVRKMPRPASDQYALGIVVYEWLCGTRPFDGSVWSISYQHLQVPPPPLRQHIPTIPSVLEEVVLKALSKAPQERFASVQAFAVALEQAYQRIRDAYSGMPSSSSPSSTGLQTPSLHTASLPVPESKPSPDSFKTATSSPSTHTAAVAESLPSPPANTPATSNRGVSRRLVILGLGVAGLAIASGGLAWLISSRTPQPPVSSEPSPTSVPSLGTLLYTYRGHTNGVVGVTWSPDGKRIASASTDRTVQVWDAVNGSYRYTYRGHIDDVWAVAWSPKGQYIASASYDGVVQVWNATDGSPVYTYHGHNDAVSAVAWSPDGKLIASAGRDRTVQIWNPINGTNVFTYRKHTDWIHAVAWSPDGRRIASGSEDTTVQVWDVANGGHALTYQGPSGISTLSWSPDGVLIASGGDGAGIVSENNYTSVQVWNASNGANSFAYRGHNEPLNAVVWAPNGKRIASASWDRTIQIWRATDGTPIFTYRGYLRYQYVSIFALAWSPDGQRIASGSSDNTVQVWQAA